MKIFFPLFIVLTLYSFKTVTRNSEWKDNYTLYKADTKNSPNSARIHFMLGFEIVTAMADTITDPERKNALLDEAIRHLGKAMEIFPLYPEAQKNVEMAEAKKNTDNLIVDFNRRLQENPNDHQTWSDVGMFFAKRGQFKESVQYFKRSAELNPSAESFSNLGNAYAMDSVFTEAITAYKKAMEFNPSNKQVFINLGSTYGNLKDYENSVYYFLKALELDPADTQLNYYIGLSYQNKGEKDKAKIYFERANRK
jgi:tetratricopeptide (TPR) repeat protein